jgi:molecular chaperone GrpE
VNGKSEQEAEMPANRYDPASSASEQPAAEDAGSEEADAGAGREGTEEELTVELARVRAAYQRLAADFENYKRRKLQETQELARYGSAALLKALLPALDNLSRAVSHIDPDATDGLSEGLRLTVRQLEEALSSQGVERVATVDQPFDPRLHDAVASSPGEGLERDTVVAEFLPGYQIHDRVVRPAQVSVAQATVGPPTGEPEGEGEQPADTDMPN